MVKIKSFLFIRHRPGSFQQLIDPVTGIERSVAGGSELIAVKCGVKAVIGITGDGTPGDNEHIMLTLSRSLQHIAQIQRDHLYFHTDLTQIILNQLGCLQILRIFCGKE